MIRLPRMPGTPVHHPTVVRRAPRVATSAATLLLAWVSILGLPVGAQEPATAAPGPSATPLPEGISDRMAERIDAVIDSVPRIRQLDTAEGIGYRVLDRDAASAEMAALFREEYPADLVAAEDDLLTRLGFLSSDDDLESLVLSLYDAQVLAYYDPRSRTFTFVGPVERIGGLESLVVAHEYGHALQDQRWDWESTRITDPSRSDAILAETALAEGDATAVMYDWAARELPLIQLIQVAASALTSQDEKTLKRVPPLLRRQLEFPYLDGFAFVNALRGRGEWAAVDAAWDARPASTEQILHPELYPDEAPISVELPDVASALGPGWTASYSQTLGEMQIGVWVADGRTGTAFLPGLPAPLPRAEAAAGWGGDRLVSLDGPDGAWAVVWQTAWDSRDDATEFRDAAAAAMKDLPGASAVLRADVAGGLSSPVLVLVADSRPTLETVQGALELEG
jgi:hypothetical protein